MLDLTNVDATNLLLQRDTKAAKTTKNAMQAQNTLDHDIDAMLAQLSASHPGTDAGGPVKVFPGQSLQSVIDAKPSGTWVELQEGVHAWTAAPDLSNKSAFRITGVGGVGYSEDQDWGTVIKPNYSGPCFIDTGVGVKHAGTKFEYLNLRPQKANAVGWLIRNVNHTLIRDCSIHGPLAAAIDTDALGVADGGDCAYNKAENLVVHSTQPDGKGFFQNNGFWWLNDDNWDLTGTSPRAIVNLAGNLSIKGGKANHAGTLFYSSGNNCDITGMHFEQAPYTGAFIVVCEKGQNALPAAGSQHKFLNNIFTPHEDAYGPGAKIAHFGVETFGNALPRRFNTSAWDKPTGSFVNDGAGGDTAFEPV